MKKIAKDVQHYLPLLGILIIGAFGFINFSYDKMFQLAIAVSVACAYFAWGIIHHYIHRDLYISVLVEYLVIAALGVVIVFSLLFRV